MRCTRSTDGSSSPQSAWPGLVKGDDALLVSIENAVRLHPGDHPLQSLIEVSPGDVLAATPCGEDRRLVADVGQVGAGQSARLLGHEPKVHVPQRLVARVHPKHALAPLHIGRGDEDLAVEASGAQQRRVELVEQVGGGDHDQSSARGEAVHLDQQLVERLVLLAGEVCAAAAADGVELVDEDDRRLLLARDREQTPDASRAKAREHLDERRRRLGEELCARLVCDSLGQQRLACTWRTVQEDALGHLRAKLLELLGVAQELDDLLQLGLGLVGAGDVLPCDRLVGGRLDLLRLDARHHFQGAPHQVDQRHEEHDHHDAGPLIGPVLDVRYE